MVTMMRKSSSISSYQDFIAVSQVFSSLNFRQQFRELRGRFIGATNLLHVKVNRTHRRMSHVPYTRVHSRKSLNFYRAMRMHGAVYAVTRCPSVSVCLSVRHTPVFYSISKLFYPYRRVATPL